MTSRGRRLCGIALVVTASLLPTGACGRDHANVATQPEPPAVSDHLDELESLDIFTEVPPVRQRSRPCRRRRGRQWASVPLVGGGLSGRPARRVRNTTVSLCRFENAGCEAIELTLTPHGGLAFSSHEPSPVVSRSSKVDAVLDQVTGSGMRGDVSDAVGTDQQDLQRSPRPPRHLKCWQRGRD